MTLERLLQVNAVLHPTRLQQYAGQLMACQVGPGSAGADRMGRWVRPMRQPIGLAGVA